MTTDNQAETQPAPLDQTVEGILARAGALVTRSAHTPMTGHFEREDPLTGDSLRVSLDDADDFEGVTVKLKVSINPTAKLEGSSEMGQKEYIA